MGYTSFVYAVTIFPGIRTKDGLLLEVTHTSPNWDAILAWAKEWVGGHNEANPQNKQRITGIVEKMAAFAAPVAYTPQLTSEQLAALRASNPELSRLEPTGAGAGSSNVPPGYMMVKAPDNSWALVKDPNYTAPPAGATAAELEKLKGAAIPDVPPVMSAAAAPSPVEGAVTKIPSGPGIVPTMPQAPAAGGSMGGPLGAFASTPVSTAAEIAAVDAEAAARLNMKP